MSDATTGAAPVTPGASSGRISARWLWAAILASVVIVLAKALGVAQAPIDALAVADNDDILRFMQVRNLLDGQGWFDARQYQLLAPEGLDLHWSRYVDLGILTIIGPLTVFMPLDQAMSAAVVIWPLALFVLLACLSGYVTQKVFGTLAGILAVLALITWVPTGNGYFVATRIDHHNMQILLSSAMVFMLILPGRALLLGVAGGILGGLSFAIGLEVMLTIVLTGLVLAVRSVWWQGESAVQFLAFSLSLAGSSALFFAGQTAPSAWAVPRCDVLSTPYLGLVFSAAAIAVVQTLAVNRLENRWSRLAGLVVLSGVAVVALLPTIRACAAGPYKLLPADVQEIIYGSIREAMPAIGPVMDGDIRFIVGILPALAGTIVATVLWIRRLRSGAVSDLTTRGLGTLLVFAWLGLVGCMFQFRLLMMGAAAYPVLIGYGLAALLPLRERRTSMRPLLGFAVLAACTLMLTTIVQIFAPAAALGRSANENTCRDPEMLRTLSAIPSARILASANVSAPLMLLTDHIALTGPYHRSVDAMVDGVMPFSGDEAQMREVIERTGADYLLLCRNARYTTDDSFASRLSAGQRAEGLVPVGGVHEDLLLLAVR